MNKRTSKILLALGTIAGLTALGNSAHSAPPVIVEMFGQNSCVYDLDLQKRVYETARMSDNVIVLNCRTLDMTSGDIPDRKEDADIMREQLKQAALEKHGVNLYFNEFCTDRAKDYSTKNGDIIPQPLRVMINGRWIASNADILPAVKMGGTDNLAEISMTRKNDTLHITMPDAADIKGKDGSLKLFVYAPSAGIKHGEQLDTTPWSISRKDKIEAELDKYRRTVTTASVSEQPPEEEQELTDEELEKLLEKEQKFEDRKNEEIQNIYFRPIAAMENIGTWNGDDGDSQNGNEDGNKTDEGNTEYTVSLTEILAQFDGEINANQLGYVVILQEGNEQIGPIIAAGELIPLGENLHVSLPASPEPKDGAPSAQK